MTSPEKDPVTDGALERLARATREHPVRLGRYDVIGTLGRGGMGTVHEAVDRDRGLHVALKTLSTVDAAASVGLKQEFRVVTDVTHPHLAPVYELGCEGDLWFFTMELVPGDSFTEWARGVPESAGTLGATQATRTHVIAESGPDSLTTLDEVPVAGDPREADLPPASPPTRSLGELRGALAELVRGIGALHDAGLRHGDIKPSNVLVRRDGHVAIVDFGLARRVSDLSRGGSSGGTPAYMAPEHLTGEEIGSAVDWYSVGVLLYVALTGRLPFHGTSRLDLYFKKTHRLPAAPRELVPAIPQDLSDACLALLRPEPAERPGLVELLQVLTERGASPDVRVRTVRSPFVGRERELGVLERAYARVRAGRLAVVHVHGPSGIGKSALVNSFVRGVRDVDRAQVLRGRCYQRESVPYNAFDGIVDELAERLQRMSTGALDALLPEHVAELARAFPALSAVPIVAARAGVAAPVSDARQLRRRAWHALIDLLRALGRARPLVLTIDDLHWADADSAALLAELVSAAPALLILVGFRPADSADNSALGQYLAAAARAGRDGALIDLPLAALTVDDATRLARATLTALGVRASDAEVSHLVREAAGVPFFVEALAHFSAARGEVSVGSSTLGEAIAARVRALPSQQRRLLQVVALADRPVPQSVALAASGLDARALPSLLGLRNASMLSGLGAGPDDVVATYHDRIRESVVQALAPAELHELHLALARALWELAARHEHSGWSFDVVRHYAAARERVTLRDERARVAGLALEAGRAARGAAAFPLALRCFGAGIEFLENDAWQREYELALGLHAGAAEAAYLAGEWVVLQNEIAVVKAQGRSPLDRLVAWEVEIDAHIGRHEYAAAVVTASAALAELGIALPTDPSPAEVGERVADTLAALERIGTERFAALADVTDPEMAAVMRLQVRVSPAAYFARPLLLPVLACNLIGASVERGLSSATPYALALFGIVLNTLDRYPLADAWGRLAVQLVDRWPDRRLEAATRHVVFNLVLPWLTPLGEVLGPLREVFDIGRRTGDLEYASYAAHGYVHNALYAGRPLAPLLDEALALGAEMRALGEVNALHVHTPFEQLLKSLVGVQSGDPACLDDEGFDEGELLARAEREGSRSGQFVLRVVMGLARLHFGQAGAAAECFAAARSYADAAPSVWHVPILHQFGALAAAELMTVSRGRERDAHEVTVRSSLASLEALARHSQHNFGHRVDLVQGALAAALGDASGAAGHLTRAAAAAAAGGWTGDAAQIDEVIARCTADRAGRVAALERSRAAYQAWGAGGKARYLAAQIARQ